MKTFGYVFVFCIALVVAMLGADLFLDQLEAKVTFVSVTVILFGLAIS